QAADGAPVRASEVLRRAAAHPLPWILILAAVLRWQSAGYFRASDDAEYASAARELLRGSYSPGVYHQLRLGLIAPTALSFALFGVKHLASVLWPMLSSLLSIVVVRGLVARTSTEAAADWGAVFLAVSTQHALSGAELFPDSPMTFLILATLDVYLRERLGAGRAWGYAAVGVLFYLAAATRI